MSPSFSIKSGVRHRYYVSSALLRGRKAQAGSVTRVAAHDIENTILMELQQRLGPEPGVEPHELIAQHLSRIDVRQKHLTLSLKGTDKPISIAVTRAKPKRRGFVGIDGDRSEPAAGVQTLMHAIARAHAWLRLLADGTYDSIERLAESVELNPKVIRGAIRLAFLPPSTTARILRGGPNATPVKELTESVGLCWSTTTGA